MIPPLELADETPWSEERKTGYLIGLKRGWTHGIMYGVLIGMSLATLLGELLARVVRP